jgi:Ca2+-binding RTX toxin-like protein
MISYDLLVENSSESKSNIYLQQSLNYAMLSLSDFANGTDFWQVLELIFGQDFNRVVAQEIQQSMREQTLVLPTIVSVDDLVLGNALGAFAIENNTIYLSQDLLLSGDIPKISATIIEEIGHWIDHQINIQDTVGDEGAIFRLFVNNLELPTEILAGLRAKNDVATISISGKSIQVEQQNFTGTSVNDTIVGSGSNDSIYGLRGADLISGGAGNDEIYGYSKFLGFGSDKFAEPDGIDGNDIIYGEEGNDTIFGDAINQISAPFAVGLGNDFIDGGKGNDQIEGGLGNDSLFGQDGVDIIDGGDGNDYIEGGAGDDRSISLSFGSSFYLKGGNGNDTIIGGLGSDVLGGGDGDDVLIGVDLNTPNLDVLSIDDLRGGAGNNVYVLGDKYSSYYINSDGANNNSYGYARISDFGSDTILLNGSANNYLIEETLTTGSLGSTFYISQLYRQQPNNSRDLIADFTRRLENGLPVGSGASYGLNLNSATFIYAPPRSLPKNDFDGDLNSNILWRNSNGAVSIWQVNSTSVVNTTNIGFVTNDWLIQDTGDFNGDRRSDILWRNSNGAVSIWQMNGNSIQTAGVIATATNDWVIQDTGDFNGDGQSDILWRNSNGAVSIWQMNGNSIQTVGVIATAINDWVIQDTGDFNGDGQSDILWRKSNGAVAIWQMNGNAIQNTVIVGTPTNDWLIKGVDDLNNDGKADILWQNANGAVAIWQMNSSSIQNVGTIGFTTSDWSIAGTGDFNKNGVNEILWRNTNGAVAVWQLNNGVVSSSTIIGAADNSWQAV